MHIPFYHYFLAISFPIFHKSTCVNTGHVVAFCNTKPHVPQTLFGTYISCIYCHVLGVGCFVVVVGSGEQAIVLCAYICHSYPLLISV